MSRLQLNAKQVFVASSSESLKLAKKIASALNDLKLNVLCWWDPEAFPAGNYTMESLIQASRICEACVLVFGADDEIWFRPADNPGMNLQPIARDNVLLEYGLFAGSVGVSKAIIVAESGVKLPSDISGVSVIFREKRETQVRTAERVQERFKEILASGRQRPGMSDSNVIIRTDWTDDIHETQSSEWSSSKLYAGRSGAVAWLEVERNSDYATRTQSEPNAVQIAKLIGGAEIKTVISLGPGSGATDKELISNLTPYGVREYIPVDINPYFLMSAANEVAKSNSLVECKTAIQCDFDNNTNFLASVVRSHSAPKRLFLMAGGTFGNSQRSVKSQLRELHNMMGDGDLFVFDLFCFGSGYAEETDPFHSPKNLPVDVQKFLARGIRLLNSDLAISDQEAILRMSTKVVRNGASGLADTLIFNIQDTQRKESFLSVRRFDRAQIIAAIADAGFSKKDHLQTSTGKLERHILLAQKEN